MSALRNKTRGRCSDTVSHRAAVPVRDLGADLYRLYEYDQDSNNNFEHDPPKLSLEKKIQLARVMKEKEELELSLNEVKRRLECVKENLGQVKSEIDVLTIEQDSLQVALDSCEDEAKRLAISAQKVEKHKNLITLINAEDSMLSELEATRQMLSTLSVSQQSFALEMNDKIDEIYQIHANRQDFEYKIRVERESTIRKNAEVTRRREIRATTAAAQKYYLELEAAKIPRPKLSREAVEKLRIYHKKALNRITTAKALSKAESESRQTRQKHNLLTLKRELAEQRDIILAANKNREEKLEERQRAVEFRRQRILEEGGDPYLIERREEKEREQRLVEKRREELQNSAVRKFLVEVRNEEKAEAQRRKLKQELDDLWTTKAREKRRLAKRVEKAYYEDLDAFDYLAKYKVTSALSFGVTERPNVGHEDNFDLLLADKMRRDLASTFEGNDLETDYERTESGETSISGVPMDEDVKETPRNAANSFKVSPAEIIFKDYDLGKIYKKKVTVCNKSNSRLRFSYRELTDSNPLPISDDVSDPEVKTKTARISDVVRVTFDPPPPIYPGLSHEFFVTFTPVTLDDFSGLLLFDSPVGQFQIPVLCLQRRFSPTLHHSHVFTFSNVIAGTSLTLEVKLTNQGSLPGNVTFVRPIRSKSPPATSENEDEFSSGNEMTETVTRNKKKGERKQKMEGDDLVKEIVSSNPVFDVFNLGLKDSNRLAGNGAIFLKATFRPEVTGEHFMDYEIGFDDPYILPLKIYLEGTCIENPFRIDPLNTNMKICLMDVNYQHPIEIRNNSDGSGRILPKIPATLKSFVEITPKSTKINPGSAALFTLRFNPRSEILNVPQFYDTETKILDFVINFHFDGFPFTVPGPSVCTFQALLDEPGIRIQPIGTLNCKIISTTETLRKKITVTNTSAAVAEFGFVEMPDWIGVHPNFGFGTLLPGETRFLDLLISPPPNMVGKQSVTLKVRTLEKKEYFIHLKAIAKIPITALKYSQIMFPVTSIGSTSYAITEVYIKGTQQKPRNLAKAGRVIKFKFLLDKKIPVDIFPNAGVVVPGKGQRLLVTFTPDLGEAEVKAHFKKLLSKKFDENLQNIQLELTTINEMITLLNPSPGGSRSGTGAPKSSNRGNKNKKGPLQNKSGRSLKKIKPSSSRILNAFTPNVIRSMDDLQLIYSDGKPPPPPNPAKQKKHLENRKDYLMKALGATLEPGELSTESLDYAKTKRDLIQNFQTSSNSYTIPCVLTLGGGDGNEEILLLTLKCPMEKPDLVILEGTPIVNFGSVQIGSKKVKEVNFFNPSIGIVNLRMGILNPYGPFVRLNALRKLAPNLVFTLRLKFTPDKEGPFEETVMIYGGGSKILVTLQGTGTPVA